ncbi:polymerase, partial [Rhizobiaceae sp. 2RAB30]
MRTGAVPVAGSKRLAWPVVLFIIALLVPWSVLIGPLRLSAYRVVLLVTVLPCLFLWLGGRAGRIRMPDILLLLYCLWCFLSLAAAHGATSGLQSGGIMFIETFGAYLLARCYIRDAVDLKNVIRLVAWVVLLLLPFSLYEAVTGKKLILDTLSAIAPTFQYTVGELRMGLRRVQGPFEHPILYGVFCGSIFAMTNMVLGEGKSAMSRWLLTASIGFTAFLSLSSAPMAGIALQLSMMLWNWALRQFKYRWKLLWGVALAGFLVVELGSNQTPVQFYISHFTF